MKELLFKALDMLANGKTAREVAKETGLSFTQLKEIREFEESILGSGSGIKGKGYHCYVHFRTSSKNYSIMKRGSYLR